MARNWKFLMLIARFLQDLSFARHEEPETRIYKGVERQKTCNTVFQCFHAFSAPGIRKSTKCYEINGNLSTSVKIYENLWKKHTMLHPSQVNPWHMKLDGPLLVAQPLSRKTTRDFGRERPWATNPERREQRHSKRSTHGPWRAVCLLRNMDGSLS